MNLLDIFKKDKKRKPPKMTIMKKSISATVDTELIKWIKKKISEDKKKYRNASHLIEIALELLKDAEKKES